MFRRRHVTTFITDLDRRRRTRRTRLDASTGAVEKVLRTDQEISHMPVPTPDGKRAFVANTNDDRVTLIDVVKAIVIDSFTTGSAPDGMAWSK